MPPNDASDWSKLLRKGERQLSAETEDADDRHAIDDDLEDEAEEEGPVRELMCGPAHWVVTRYLISAEIDDEMQVPTFHDWQDENSESELVPFCDGTAALAFSIARLFGCRVDYAEFRAATGTFTFHGADSHPEYASEALSTVVRRATQRAFKLMIQSPRSATGTSLLRALDFVDGYCAHVAADLASFCDVRNAAFADSADGRLVSKAYAVPEPSVSRPAAPTWDDDYQAGMSYAKNAAHPSEVGSDLP
jgi:hypothetical protein